MPNVLPYRAYRRSRRAVAGAAAAGLVVLSGGVAYGYWSVSGSGSVQAKSVTAQAVTLSVTAGAADLYPGANGAVYFSVNNPNDYAITLSSATFGAVTPDDAVACPASNVTTTNKTGLSLVVPAGSTGTAFSLPSAVSMVAAAPNGCQGRTFTIAATVAGLQS